MHTANLLFILIFLISCSFGRNDLGMNDSKNGNGYSFFCNSSSIERVYLHHPIVEKNEILSLESISNQIVLNCDQNLELDKSNMLVFNMFHLALIEGNNSIFLECFENDSTESIGSVGFQSDSPIEVLGAYCEENSEEIFIFFYTKDKLSSLCFSQSRLIFSEYDHSW